MNDDNLDATPAGAPGGSRRRTAAVAAAVGVGGLLAGGLAAGALSSASADTGSGAAGQSAYGATVQQGDPSKPMRSDEKLLTGDTRTKVLAAVQKKYPDATVQRAETDSDGVYEAHVVTNGQELIVQVGKDFTITGTQSGPGGGHGDGDGDGPGGQPPASESGSTQG